MNYFSKKAQIIRLGLLHISNLRFQYSQNDRFLEKNQHGLFLAMTEANPFQTSHFSFLTLIPDFSL
jgi:hypothetical protein